MSRTLSLLVLGLFACAVFITGCFDRLNAWEKQRLESQTSEDIASILDEMQGVSQELTPATTARDSYEVDLAGIGGCTRHYVYDGDATAGTVVMTTVGEDCTTAVTLNDVRYEYTINEHHWDGSWALRTDDLYDVEWAGVVDSTLVVSGGSKYDGEYNAGFTMNAATGVTDGAGNISEWSIDYDYSGFLDRDWHVEAAMDADGTVSGTVTGTAANCTISGVQYDYIVDCE